MEGLYTVYGSVSMEGSSRTDRERESRERARENQTTAGGWVGGGGGRKA